MQNKHFLFHSFYIFVHDIHIKYNDCNIYIWGISVQCCPANKEEKKRKQEWYLREVLKCLCKEGQRWKRRPERDRPVRRCHICPHTASVKSLCPSRHIQSKTPSQEKLPRRLPSPSPSSLLHFTSRSLCLPCFQVRSLESFFGFYIVTLSDVYLKNNKHTRIPKLRLTVKVSQAQINIQTPTSHISNNLKMCVWVNNIKKGEKKHCLLKKSLYFLFPLTFPSVTEKFSFFFFC